MSRLLAYLPFFKNEQPPLPELHATDDIIPVHLFDDSAAARGIVLVRTFRFDDVLDPEERPAVHFTQEHYDSSMMEHPLAAKLPRPTGKLATYPGPKEFCSLGLGPGTPRNIDDFVFSGKPQFCLHVQTFTDGTLVSVTYSHISTDLMGFASIFKAWSSVLAGKPEAVPPMVGYRDDAFDALWNPAPKQRHVLENKVLDGWRFKYWGLRSLYDSWCCSEVHSRTLCVPRHTMENMMQEARSHIAAEVDATTSESKISFISEGDVLTAIACRMQAQYHGPDSGRQLATIMAVDPRSRVKSVFRQDAAYVQNSPNNIYLFYRAKQVLELPLGKMALLVREAIASQATEEQLKAAASLSVESMRATKMPVIFGDKDMTAQFMSNWTKGSLAEKMDFGPAVIREAAARPGKSKRGHPVWYQTSDPSHNTVSVISSVFVVMEKDYDGNTWLSVSLPGKMRSDLMSYLEQFG
ncbi:MAG: hypothetical protein M1822_002060 [Bathelium mastoideum]|nr:MAG: hypothetical protein M1822_002060 [Bathelium mastoideum]